MFLFHEIQIPITKKIESDESPKNSNYVDEKKNYFLLPFFKIDNFEKRK